MNSVSVANPKFLDIIHRSINRDLISARKEGDVYYDVSTRTGEKYVVKERKDCSGCLEYEYKVGCLLNKLHHPNLVETHYYYNQDGSDYLYLSPAIGQTLNTYYMTLTKNSQMRLLLKHIFYIIRELQILCDFTHYDLHSENILVSSGEPVKYNYAGVGEIISPYRIKFIDYGTVHVDGMKSMNREGFLGQLDYGMSSGIFDPLYDFLLLAITFNPFTLDPERIKKLANDCGFVTDEESRYYGREEYLSQFPKFVRTAAFLPTIYVPYGNFNNLPDFHADLKRVDDSLTRYAMLYSKIMCKTYIPIYCMYMHDLKFKRMKDRPYTVDEVFRILIDNL